jgi:hypothetical protein
MIEIEQKKGHNDLIILTKGRSRAAKKLKP